MTIRPPAAALAAALAVLVALTGSLSGALDTAEQATLKARFAVRGVQPAPELAVVAIDERTFSELDTTWPMSRRLHARLVDRLRRAGARAIVYDVQFTEPSADARADVALYDALDRAGGGILATGESDRQGRTRVLGGDENLAAIRSRAAASNLPARRGATVYQYGRVVGALPTVATATAERVGHPVSAGAFDGDGHALIDFRGPPGTVATYSFGDVVRGRVPAARLRDRIVVVGASAATLQDLHPTPTTGTRPMSGPEVQASAIWTAMHGNPLRAAPGGVTLLLTLLFAALPGLLALRLRVGAVAAVAALAAAGFSAIAAGAFARGAVVAVVAPLVALGVAMLGVVVSGYLRQVHERRRMAEYNRRLEGAVASRTTELREAQLEVVGRLALAAESRDGDTGLHIERMSELAELVALGAGADAREAELLRHAAVLHDVGKIAIPDAILLKPGPLDIVERAVMERHAEIGAQMLAGSPSPLLQLGERIALTHHERWDGRGYPRGLAGPAIPWEGRVVALCDVFDALMSPRPYKDPWDFERAIAEIESQAGMHFDPDLVPLFVSVVRARRDEIERRYVDDGATEMVLEAAGVLTPVS